MQGRAFVDCQASGGHLTGPVSPLTPLETPWGWGKVSSIDVQAFLIIIPAPTKASVPISSVMILEVLSLSPGFSFTTTMTTAPNGLQALQT